MAKLYISLNIFQRSKNYVARLKTVTTYRLLHGYIENHLGFDFFKNIDKMRVVAMVSGGKDSCYNMMQCVAEGHEIVALANLHPKDRDELDSYMYQTVGHMGIEKLAEAMELPLYRMETKGISTQTGKHYVPTDDDEVEDLFNLLKWTKDELNVEAVAVGAIFSDYQRVRVENVCIRLNLVPLAYLWRRDQTELLQEMIDCKVFAIIIKVASLGLVPDRHLGKSISEVQSHLIKMKEKYGLNVCGEGGEYETFTLNCPLFKQKIIVDDMQTIVSSSDPVCPVGYINFTKLRLVPKDKDTQLDVVVKTSLDYLSDLNESSYNDLSDPDLSESELEQIEMENRLKETMTKDDLITSRSNSLTHGTTSPVKILQSKTKSCEDVRPLNSPLKVVYEHQDILNRPNYVFNNNGWMWISGVEGYGTTAREGMEDTLDKINELLSNHKYELHHVCYTTLYIRNMSDYVNLNEAYSKTFNFPNPPTRVCVECPLPPNCQVVVEVVAFKARNEVIEVTNKRHTMHVQGISHWAPANIGPYSQSTKIGDITYISGQIALVPGSMKIIEGGIKAQCKLTLRHINRISKAMHAQGQLRDVVQGICFVTHPNYISEARRQWEKRTTNAIVDYIVCPALPRQALVEWQVWAHAHNDKFDYEETGCSVGEYTVFSRRRWNYESNCAAIVCYVTTGLASSTTQLTDLTDDTINRHRRMAGRLSPENIDEILTYTVNKLTKGQPVKTDPDVIVVPIIPSVHLKIFYQVNAAPPVDLLMQSINEFREKSSKFINFAFTVIPACSLQNFSTFLSISGVKHE